ncbi:MAG: dihydroxyacetone kinase subunit DhaK [Candidatus Heritagella sp.]
MKKLINHPDELVNETLQGYAMANKNIIELVPGSHMIVRKNKKEKGKVKFVLGNGAGHEPAVIGWVGPGMLDMNIVGEVFTAPSSDKILEALKYIDDGSPILLAVQNHAGDVLNANLAYADAIDEGLDVHKVLFYDDVASAPKGMEEERRGMAGMLFYTKIVGAFLEAGGDIDEAVELFEKVRDATRTYSVAFTKCTHPITGLDIIALPEEEIELGMGVHGEGGGANRIPMQKSRDLAAIIGKVLVEDLPYEAGDEVLLFINGLGSTTAMELSLFYKDMVEYLEGRNIHVYDGFCDNCLTTQELGGVSVSLCRVDEEEKKLWDAPCQCGIQCKP